MRYRFDVFEFDADNLQLNGPAGSLPLRPMTVRLLRALISQAPQLLRHDELLDQVWGRQAVTQGVLSQSIRELRQALGDSAQEPRFIETKHRLGYRFIGEVARVIDSPDTDAQPGQADVNVSIADPPMVTSSRRNLPARMLFATVLLALMAWWLWPGAADDVGSTLRATEVIHDGRPREPQALEWYRQGLHALDQGDLTNARERLQRSLQREPDAVATQAALGEVAAKAGAIDIARRWAQSAEENAANLPRAEQLRISAFRAGLEYRWTDAESHLQALFQLNPGDAESGFRLIEAQLQTGHLDAVDDTLTKLQALRHPTLDRFRLALLQARLAAARGDHPARLAAAEAAFALAKDAAGRAEAGLDVAWSHLLLGDAEAARRALTDARQKHALPPRLKLRLDTLEATLLRESGDYDAARQRFLAVADAADAIGQDVAAARSRREAAYVQALAGDAKGAIESLRPVLDRLREQGDRRELASAEDVMSVAQQRAGDPRAAQKASESALAAYLEAGDRIGEAAARNHFGMLLARSGRADEAREQWEKARSLFASLGDRRGTATVLSNLAIAYGRTGRSAAAREANEAALAAFRDVGSMPDVARLQFNMGVQDRRAGQLAAAEARFDEALEAFADIGAEDFRRQAAASLAELRMSRANLAGAAAALQRADQSGAGSVQSRAAFIGAVARLSALRGDFEAAETGFREARSLREKAGLADWVLMNTLDLAELSARRGQLTASEQSIRETRRAMIDGGDVGAALQAGILLAGVQAAQGQVETASRLLDQLESERNAYPDAMLSLRLDLVRAAIRPEGRGEALQAVATSARGIGFELLALRADLMGGVANAREQLQQRGILVEGMPPPLPY
ncbi:MAG: winged helix-turn-helix domain-containing protein [Xanthomonadales bacterium]|nr:winged helix-turn-helix domain-containing protein [Xanthomonadales bacterium]